MDAAVSYPTVLLGLGRFGHEVIGRALQSLEASSPLLGVLRCEPSGVAAGLQPLLEDLLRAGRGSGERRDQRLDLIAFAAALQGGDQDLLVACDQAARLLAEGYGAMFPPDRPPEQRTASLHLVVQVPALSNPRASVALARLAALESWARSRPVFPLLARIWVVSQQTAAGTLTSEEMVSTCASFALGMVASGLRTEDEVSRRLAHPALDEGLVGFVSLASVELPESRLRAYAAARAAYDGLGVLVERVQEPGTDATLAMGAVSALQRDRWLAPFVEGQAAQLSRRLAAELSRSPVDLPADIHVGPLDTPEEIRARHAGLFKPASVEAAPTTVDQARTDETFRALDRAEAEVASSVEQGIQAVFDASLGPTSGLSQLPAVEQGLKRVIAQLHDEQVQEDATLRKLDPSQPPGPPVDPHREELEHALLALPSRGMAFAAAAALALAVLLGVSFGTLSLMTPAAASAGTGPARVQVTASATPVATGFDWREAMPWIVGVLAALGAGGGWLYFVGNHTRKEVRRVLKLRRDALESLVSRGGGGRRAKQAELQLVVRRKRARRGAILALENAVARLQAVRHALLEARDRKRQELLSLGVTPAAEARLDDLGPLLGAGGLLHGSLVPPEVISRWIAARREISEDRVWADRLLEGAWPEGGLLEDVPCGDPERVAELSRRQVQPMGERSVLDDPEGGQQAADVLRDFGARMGAVLAPPCQPLNAHGDPVLGLRPGEGFVIAPSAGRDTLDAGLRDVPTRLPVLWSPSKAARVIFLRTWEGFSVEEVTRGARSLSQPAVVAPRGAR
ncbi:hypothetical protein JQX13_30150 [Archangium violaceum]|uniref:hypothetical protein n=1 Tax=Archangium violaceum TaxID=83451 RepID=UPI00193BFD61|nr:hypothetical protein [Archangium violaceum]QRK04510.1 hypothetical protein JQX13_30150 [Archangium violaceum]